MTHLFRIAKEESLKSEDPRTKIGCILEYNGTIISKGHNGPKTHPLQHRKNVQFRYKESDHYFAPTIHAELACLMPMRWTEIDWNKANLYIYREHKDGSPAMCRPCPACMDVIRNQFKIKTVYYTTENGWAKERLK